MAQTTGISPTLLCADHLNLGQQIDTLDQLRICWHHVDVMDGHFVENLAFGMDTVAAVKSRVRKPVFVHLMVEEPEKYFDRLSKMRIDYCAFHLEATYNPFRAAQTIMELGMKPGLVISPITPVETSFDLLACVDVITVMAVEPGYSGQKFMEQTYGRIRKLKSRIQKRNLPTMIEVDGGIDEKIGAACVSAGADVLVGGVFTIFRPGHVLKENFDNFDTAIRRSRKNEAV